MGFPCGQDELFSVFAADDRAVGHGQVLLYALALSAHGLSAGRPRGRRRAVGGIPALLAATVGSGAGTGSEGERPWRGEVRSAVPSQQPP